MGQGMQNNLKKPGVILAAALLVFFAGGFLLLVHIGASGRTAPARHYAPGYRGASAASSMPSSSYLEDFKRGGEIVKEKGEAAFAGFFGGSSRETPAYGRSASAGGGAGREEEEDPDGSAFEEYYKKNYASSRGGGASAGQPSGAEMGGGGSAYGGSGGGGYAETSAGAADGGAPQKGEPAGEEAPGAVVQVPASGTGFGKPPAGQERAAAPRLQASLSGKNSPENAGFNPGARPGSSAGDGGNQLYKGGSLSGMPGQKAGVPLDGAAEGMKAGAQKNYDSKASGGASAGVAAAGGAGGSSGGGSSPAASAPKDAAAEAKAAASTAKTNPGTATDEGGDTYEEYYSAKPSSAEPDLLSMIVKERQNGADAKLVSDEDAAGEPEVDLLVARAVATDKTDKAVQTPDPASFKALPEARKTELKKEVHTFLRRVENKYGKMNEIFRTSCSTTPELCKEHEVSGSYLTMTTQKGAKLLLGFKYVEKRWRRYTMDFKAPASAVKPPVPEEPADEEVPEEAQE